MQEMLRDWSFLQRLSSRWWWKGSYLLQLRFAFPDSLQEPMLTGIIGQEGHGSKDCTNEKVDMYAYSQIPWQVNGC
jgi:hypothetical protein